MQWTATCLLDDLNVLSLAQVHHLAERSRRLESSSCEVTVDTEAPHATYLPIKSYKNSAGMTQG